MSKRKVGFLSVVLVIVTALLSSCNEFESIAYMGRVPNWTVSINEIVRYPRANPGEKEIPSFDGRPIWVRKNYELFSKTIEDIEPIPIEDNPGYYKLKLTLNEHGSLKAMRLCNDLGHAPWAFLVNGVFYRTITFENSIIDKDYHQIIINGPFDKIISDHISEYAHKNYVYYNKND